MWSPSCRRRESELVSALAFSGGRVPKVLGQFRWARRFFPGQPQVPLGVVEQGHADGRDDGALLHGLYLPQPISGDGLGPDA